MKNVTKWDNPAISKVRNISTEKQFFCFDTDKEPDTVYRFRKGNFWVTTKEKPEKFDYEEVYWAYNKDGAKTKLSKNRFSVIASFIKTHGSADLVIWKNHKHSPTVNIELANAAQIAPVEKFDMPASSEHSDNGNHDTASETVSELKKADIPKERALSEWIDICDAFIDNLNSKKIKLAELSEKSGISRDNIVRMYNALESGDEVEKDICYQLWIDDMKKTIKKAA